MTKLVFLPGASGKIDFWNPLISFLPKDDEKQIISYPGFGGIAEDSNLKSFLDLQEYVTSQINSECIIIAQSMGGIFAVQKAIEAEHLIKGLVLIATSGGIDLTPFKVKDWRMEYQEYYPTYPEWFVTANINYDDDLEMINLPVLLIWGDADPISPVAIGKYLNRKLKNSALKVISNGKHNLAEEYAKEVSVYINQFLENIS